MPIGATPAFSVMKFAADRTAAGMIEFIPVSFSLSAFLKTRWMIEELGGRACSDLGSQRSDYIVEMPTDAI